jgi:tetratricopeptide (TPR) repeat protein
MKVFFIITLGKTILLTILILNLFFSVFGQDPTKTRVDSLLLNTTSLNNIEILFLKQAAYTYQNQVFLVEENKKDFKQSLSLINRSIEIWGKLNDTASLANIQKYRGYLFANLKKYQEARYDIFSAISLFQKIGNQAGVAVSEFDLAKCFMLEGKMDSAVVLITKSKGYWESKNDTTRLLGLNNNLVDIGTIRKKGDDALRIFNQSKTFVEKSDIHWRVMLDFYFTSFKLFSFLKDKENELNYFNNYKSLLKNLKERKVHTKSQYDHDRKD